MDRTLVMTDPGSALLLDGGAVHAVVLRSDARLDLVLCREKAVDAPEGAKKPDWLEHSLACLGSAWLHLTQGARSGHW